MKFYMFFEKFPTFATTNQQLPILNNNKWVTRINKKSLVYLTVPNYNFILFKRGVGGVLS